MRFSVAKLKRACPRIITAVSLALRGVSLCNAQQASTNPAADAEILTEVFLKPAITVLSQRSAARGVALPNLHRVRIRVDTLHKRIHNAWSYTAGDTAKIDIDLLFFDREILPYAYLGATTLMTSNRTDTLWIRIGKKYADKIKSALLQGNPVPGFELDPAEIADNAIHEEALHETARDISLHFFAFFVLHELGHIQLGHVRKRGPPTAAESKLMEMAADNWAYDTMARLDYSLELLQAGIAGKAMGEITRDAFIHERTDSGYPTWQVRLSSLSEFMESHPPSAERTLRFSGYAHITSGTTSRAYVAKLTFQEPTSSSYGMATLRWNLQNPTGDATTLTTFGTAERSGSEILIRFRLYPELILTIAMPVDRRFEAMSTWTHWAANAGKWEKEGSFTLLFFYTGLSEGEGTTIAYYELGKIIDFDMAGLIRRLMAERSLDESLQTRAQTIVESYSRAWIAAAREYAAGGIDDRELEQRIRILRAVLQTELLTVVGPSVYEEFKRDLSKVYDRNLILTSKSVSDFDKILVGYANPLPE